MSESVEQNVKAKDERGRAQFLTMALGIGLTHLLTAAELLPVAEAVWVAWSIALLVGYWLPPKPTESFLRWILESLIFVTAFYLAFFRIPAWLKHLMPPLMAYGIPILVFFIFYVLSSTWGRALIKRRA